MNKDTFTFMVGSWLQRLHGIRLEPAGDGILSGKVRGKQVQITALESPARYDIVVDGTNVDPVVLANLDGVVQDMAAAKALAEKINEATG